MIRRTHAALVLVAACAAMAAPAVGRRLEAGDSPPAMLYPGDARICGGCIVPGTDTLQWLGRTREDTIAVLSKTEVTTRRDPRHPDHLMRWERADSYTDSFVVVHSTLAPIRGHATENGARTSVDFTDRQVRGSIDRGARSVPVHVNLPRPAFLSNSIDLLAGALAGTHGLSVNAAFVDPANGGAPLYHHITVLGRRTAVLRSGERCSARVVRVHHRGAFMDYWVEEQTRRLIFYEARMDGYPRRTWLEASRCPRRGGT